MPGAILSPLHEVKCRIKWTINSEDLEEISPKAKRKKSPHYFLFLSLFVLLILFFSFERFTSNEPAIFSLKATHPDFIRRNSYMKSLQKSCLGSLSKKSVAVGVLWGTGGVGKSELAISFGNHYARRFSLIFWIESDTEEIYQQRYKDLAQILGIHYQESEPFHLIQDKVHRHLSEWKSSKPWLLIFDNAEKALKLPSQGYGSIIVTSRNREHWHPYNLIEVRPFTEQEAFSLIEKITRQKNSPVRSPLIHELEFFPLAINQAAHYILETPGMTEESYFELLKKNKTFILKNMHPELRYPYTLTASWKLTSDHLREECPKALDWLYFSSYLHPDVLPYIWMEKWLAQKKGDLPLQFEKAEILRYLVNYSMIRFDQKSSMLSLHRLRQDVLLNQNPQSEATKQEVLEFLSGLDASFTNLHTVSCSPELWDELRAWEPNAAWFLDHHFPQDSPSLAKVQTILGNWYHVKGSLKQALALYEKSLKINRTFLPQDHPEIAMTLYCFAMTLADLGDYQEAEKIHKEVLEMREGFYGKSHPTIRDSLSGIGWAQVMQEKYTEAMDYYQRSLKLSKKINGDHHFDTIGTLANLGWILDCMGVYEESTAIFKETLTTMIQTYGYEHPYTTNIMDALACAYCKHNHLEEAKELHQQALQIRKKHRGPKHPYTAESFHNLGIVYEKLGKYRQAKEHYERALNIRLELYEPDHPEIIQSQKALSRVLSLLS